MKSLAVRFGSFFVMGLVFIGTRSLLADDSIFVVNPNASEIKVLSYNLLNLFDAQHDSGKDDYTFLPKNFPGKTAACEKLYKSNKGYGKLCFDTDWSEDKMLLKIEQIKKALSYQGELPDLMGVQEIENAKVATELADTLGYGKQFLITDSPDPRGIDVALFYRTEKLRLIETEEIPITGADFTVKATRNILRAHFALEHGDKSVILGVYVNHWPSPAGPPEKRVGAANILKAAIDKQTKRIGKNNYFVVALGDFNTLSEETPNAIHHVVANPDWNNALFDAQENSFSRYNPARAQMPSNSHWYITNNTWDKLDRILLSQNFDDKQGLEVVPSSFRILAAKGVTQPFEYTQTNSFKFGNYLPAVPWRYNFSATSAADAGFSDHLPIYLKIKGL